MERLWDFFIDSCMAIFIPLVTLYYAVCGNFFLNTTPADSSGIEKAASTLLIPFQYLFDGQSASLDENGVWVYQQRFDYSEQFWTKTAASVVALPSSFILGSALKGLSLLIPSSKQRYIDMQSSYFSPTILSHVAFYRKLGLDIIDPQEAEWVVSEKYARRSGDENHLKKEKEALKEIATLLNQAGIPWWVDCGTCLGVYRHGGVIPWDGDIDIAVLLPDHDNVRRALTGLDPKKYIVQDWSGRLNPQNYFKVFIQETGTLVDIYHFKIHPENRTIQYLLSLESSSLFPEWWKIRERRFKIPASFTDVFPLKKGMLDGIEVFMPNNPEKYLQRCYGENLAPAKIYDHKTNQYEKDLSHPYWQRAYAH